jgi:hypothetical protein
VAIFHTEAPDARRGKTKPSVSDSSNRDVEEVIRMIVQRGEGRRRGSYFGWLGRARQPDSLRASNIAKEELMSLSKADDDQQQVMPIETRFDKEAQ